MKELGGSWEKSPIDILMATPISGQEMVYHEWHENILNLWLNLPPGLKIVRMRFPEPVVDISRDKAVQVAIQNGARWLFFLDSDIIPPPDTLSRLLAHNLPIVGGLYVRRHNPPFNEMLRLNENGLGLRAIQDGEYQDGALVECDAIATGCMLINTEVFEKMKPFQLTIDGQPARPQFFLWTEFRLPGVSFSEDFSFCVRARQQGIPIYCDTSIKLKHMGPAKFVPSGNNSLAIEFPGS